MIPFIKYQRFVSIEVNIMNKKTVVIVGSNRGIGLELARQYSLSHEVYALCREASVELKNLNVRLIEGVDASSLESLKVAAGEVEPSIDLFLHNAGIMSDENIQNLDQAAFDRMQQQFLINSLGPLKSVSAFLTKFKEGSKIGLVTSRMGSIADNTSGGRYGYRASKTALNAFGKSLAHDLEAKGVAVALLHPGWVQTDMTNFTGHLTPEQSAEGLSKIMEGLTLEKTGKFWHVHGEELPW